MDTSLTESVFARTLEPSAENWRLYGPEILRLEHLCFGQASYTESELERDCTHTNTILAILQDSTAAVADSAAKPATIGYGYALPDEDLPDAAYLSSIAIDPQFQGRGLVGRLLGLLEEQIKLTGRYTYLTLDAAIENGFADSINRHYHERVIESNDHDSQWGRQRYFKIAL